MPRERPERSPPIHARCAAGIALDRRERIGRGNFKAGDGAWKVSGTPGVDCGGVASVAAVALAVIHLREIPAAVYPVRFEQPVPAMTTFRPGDVPAVSPDGQSFA